MSLETKLKEIKDRAEAATQGNWSGAVEFLEGPSREDKDFIAHSRQDIEMLLEMVETYQYFFKLAAPVETHFHLKTTGELLKEMRKELEKIAEKYT